MIINIASKLSDIPQRAIFIRFHRDSSSHGYWTYGTYYRKCVRDREANHYNDSDFYMTVFDEEKDCFKEIEYATTRAWTYPAMGSNVDATDELKERYAKVQAAIAAHYKKLREEAEAKRPAKGKRVRVVKGRKHVGKEGKVFWQGANQFRTYYKNGYNKPSDDCNQRLGIQQDDGTKFFVPFQYAEVIQQSDN